LITQAEEHAPVPCSDKPHLALGMVTAPLKQVVFLADGTEDFAERFAPLVRELRAFHPGCLVTALFYFEGHSFCAASPLPFDALLVASDRAGLRAQIQSCQADLMLVLVRHYPTPHDHDLTIFAEASGKMRVPTGYLFNNSHALRDFLASGADQHREVAAHLRRIRSRNREVKLKIGLVYGVASLVLPALGLLRRLVGKEPGERQRILFLRLDVLWDMVLTLPALKALRERYPQAEITVIASQRGAALLCGRQELFDRLIVWESPWHSKQHRLLGAVDLLATVRFLAAQWRVGYDLTLQPVELATGVLFALLFQAATTVSVISERLPLARLLRRFVTKPVPVASYSIYHISELPDAVAVKAGVDACQIDFYRHRALKVDDQSREQIQGTLRSAGYSKATPLVLVNVGAGHPRRRWPAKKFSALCDLLGPHCFLVVVGGDQETAVAGEIAALTSSKVLNLAGQLSLDLLVGLCAECDLVVSGDTGVMHLAAALNRRIVALFGAGLLDFCRPLCDRHLILRHELGCSGCHDICFAEGTAPCLEMIQVEEVADAALRLLQERDRT
jgi:ADP-heptose:LPS heptosyltransferase